MIDSPPPKFFSGQECPGIVKVILDPKKYLTPYVACVELPEFKKSNVTVTRQVGTVSTSDVAPSPSAAPTE